MNKNTNITLPLHQNIARYVFSADFELFDYLFFSLR